MKFGWQTLGLATKTRPVVVVSRYDQNPPRALVIYVPLTTQNRDSFANVQGLGSIPRVRLERKLGQLPNEIMQRIKQAILFALDLELDY